MPATWENPVSGRNIDVSDAAWGNSCPAVAADFLSETSPIAVDQHVGFDRSAQN